MKKITKKVKIKGHWLTIANYKEPLLAIPEEKGFGYMGTLLCTPKGELVQCHVCGELYKDLAMHAKRAHQIKSVDYKRQFSIAYNTSLVSEKERLRRRDQYVKMLANMTPEQKQAYIQARFKGWREWNKTRTPQMYAESRRGKKKRLELYNLTGTCPDQVLDKLRTIVKEVGHTPSQRELTKNRDYVRWFYLARHHFGTLNEAWKLLNIPHKEAYGKSVREYTPEMLLGFFKAYHKKYNKVPTHSDFKRGILPRRKIYLRHFGSLDNARKLAGLPYWGNSKETMADFGGVKQKIKKRFLKETIGLSKNQV